MRTGFAQNLDGPFGDGLVTPHRSPGSANINRNGSYPFVFVGLDPLGLECRDRAMPEKIVQVTEHRIDKFFITGPGRIALQNDLEHSPDKK